MAWAMGRRFLASGGLWAGVFWPGQAVGLCKPPILIKFGYFWPVFCLQQLLYLVALFLKNK